MPTLLSRSSSNITARTAGVQGYSSLAFCLGLGTSSVSTDCTAEKTNQYTGKAKRPGYCVEVCVFRFFGDRPLMRHFCPTELLSLKEARLATSKKAKPFGAHNHVQRYTPGRMRALRTAWSSGHQSLPALPPWRVV